jgi:putative PIN family toxin of toxin-antitoxin system
MESKFFIDSNVWFSALFSKGTCYQLIRTLLNNEHEIVVSEIVVQEIFRNIKKKKPQALPPLNRLLGTAPITIVENPKQKKINNNLSLAHKKDLPIIISAVNYQCDYFITGKIKDFNKKPIKEISRIKILSPRQALSKLTT